MSCKIDCPGSPCGLAADWKELENTRNVALDTTAEAFRWIDMFYDFSARNHADHLGNVRDARYHAGSAMVHLAIAAGGENDDRIKDILSGYGLQHLLYK